MRSNAPASPCWARRMASASVISLDSDRLVRVTVPVGTHPVCGMHPWLLELHLCKFLVLVWYRRWGASGKTCRPAPQRARRMVTAPFSPEMLRSSRAYRNNIGDVCDAV